MKKCNKILLAGLAAITAQPLWANDKPDPNWAKSQAAASLQVAIAELDMEMVGDHLSAFVLPQETLLIVKADEDVSQAPLAE